MFTDEFGRVLIRFWWQRREDQPDANEYSHSCWVRVAYGSFAGDGWGFLGIPRVGQEVLVAYFDGDPDKPVVVGALYNGKNRPSRLFRQLLLPKNKAVSGVRTKEFGGNRGSGLVFDDTSDQIQTNLACDHAQSELNLGYLTGRRGGKAFPRGEGAELRSDKSVAIRAGKGLLLSAAAQVQADGVQLERTELLELLEASRKMLETIAGFAAKHQGLMPDFDGLQKLQENILNMEKGTNTAPRTNQPMNGQQIVAVSAPDGLLAGTKENMNLVAGGCLYLSSKHNGHFTLGQQLLVSAGGGISIFAHTGNFKAITHAGDFSVQAQKGGIDILADKNIKIISSGKEVIVFAKKKIALISGDSYLKIGDGNIELGCTGTITGKSARCDWKGPADINVDLSNVETGKTQRKFKLRRAGTGEAFPNKKYRITLNDGRVITGTSDEKGLTDLVESDSMKIMHIQTLSHLENLKA